MSIHYTPPEDAALKAMFFEMAHSNGILPIANRQAQRATYATFHQRMLPYIRAEFGSLLAAFACDAEDIFQTVIRKMIESIQKNSISDTQNGIIAYIITIINNLKTDMLRKKRRKDRIFNTHIDTDDLPETAANDIYYGDVLKNIGTIIPKLSEKERIIMYIIMNNETDDLSTNQIIQNSLTDFTGKPCTDGNARKQKTTTKQKFINIGKKLGFWISILSFLRIFVLS